MTPRAVARALPGWLSLALVLGCSQPAPDASPAPERDPPEAAVEAGAYEYQHLDVFTDRPLTGNQLAVFLRPEGLTADQMMAITREMAFSETTFVFPAETPDTDFRVRIFGLNSGGELPMAGHPTIGTVFALADAGLIEPGRPRLVLGLGIGPTPLELSWRGSELDFVWMQQLAPTVGPDITDRDAVAAALGVEAADLVTDLPIQQISCGAPFVMVPLATRVAVDRARLDRDAMGAVLDRFGAVRRGIMVFSTEGADATAYSRMFGFGVAEDPATGNASGPLGAYLVHQGLVPRSEGEQIVSRQGVAMGRPSRVHIRIRSVGEAITEVQVGGRAALVGRGSVRVR